MILDRQMKLTAVLTAWLPCWRRRRLLADPVARAGRCAASPRPQFALGCRHRRRAAHRPGRCPGRRSRATSAGRPGRELPLHACGRTRARAKRGTRARRAKAPASRTPPLRDRNSRWRCAASADMPREEGEALGSASTTLGERFAFARRRPASPTPDDGKTYRPDGSYAAVVLGNWMLHAGYIDRWWGPGWEGSLIYGSNARPIPSITIERNYSDADQPSLAGVDRAVPLRGDDGPARGRARRRAERPALRNARDLEAALARRDRHFAQRPVVRRRSALRPRHVLGSPDRQRQRPVARGTAGQPDGWLRRALVAALGAGRDLCQAIGEDEADFLPSKYLGSRSASSSGAGSASDPGVRTSSTPIPPAASTRATPEFGCAYRNVIYSDGYQYYDRSIGHSIDGDSASSQPAACW